MDGPFTLITQAALDHYRASLAGKGYAEADFEVTERVDPPPRNAIATWGFVIVTCKVNDVERRYRAGPSLSWTDAFDADLSRGVYLAVSPDTPPKVMLLQTRTARFLNNLTDGKADKKTRS